MAPRTRRPTPRRPAAQRRTSNVRDLRTPERPRIEVVLEDLSDFNESSNILVHGDSGAGKTVLAAFAPRAYFLSTEKGVVAAQRVGSKAKLLRATDWDHVEASLDWADEHLGLDDWMILDSLTKMQVLQIRWILEMQHSENEARDLDIPAIQDHQKWQNMFKRFVDRIVDANYNTIFITTSMHREDPEGEPMVLPDITGKDYSISNYVCAAMDVVLYLGMARQNDRNAPAVRRLLSEKYPPWFAKDRYHVLPRWLDIEDEDYTTMPWIIDQIMEIDPEQRKAAKAAER